MVGARRGHRRLRVVTGSPEWCAERARALVHRLDPAQVVHISSGAPRRERQALLGREVRVAVVDLHPGLDPDVLGAVHGVVRGGGELVLLTPSLGEWPALRGPVEERMAVWPHAPPEVGTRLVARFAELCAGADVLDEPVDAHDEPADVLEPVPGAPTAEPVRPTEEQGRALGALRGLAADPPRQVVLTSDRGRGKSTTLGLAVAPLLDAGVGRVVLTARRRRSAEAGLRAVHEALTDSRRSRVSFLPPEEAARIVTPDDALLVDEAATLAVPTLVRLLEATPRIAFATTVHGYEGTGRGFVLRFLETLHARHPHVERLHLSEPIRWDRGDPVEAFVHHALLLDAEPSDLGPDAPEDPSAWDHAVLDRDRLAEDDPLLRAVFGLLVHAHYRTTPGDLRRMLDAPNLQVHVLRRDGLVGAAAVVAREGGLPRELSDALYTGGRRLRGHALPENLVCHLGLPEAGALTVRRVVRIATHPAVRRRGLGSALLEALTERAAAEGVDLLGSVFGATPDLLAFWERNGHRLIRVSVARGAASGEHSTLVARPLSAEAVGLLEHLRHRLARDLPHALGDSLSRLDPDLALQGLRGLAHGADADLDETDRLALGAYVHGPRPYDVTARVAFAVAVATLGLEAPPGTEEQRRLVMAKVVQRRGWPEVARAFGHPSVPAAMRAVRAALRPFAESVGIRAPR